MGREAASSLMGRRLHVFLHVSPSLQRLIAHYPVKLGELLDRRRLRRVHTLCWAQRYAATDPRLVVAILRHFLKTPSYLEH